MFELIVDKLPELRKLEQVVATLEREHAEAQGRVAQLANEIAAAREDDLNREALALNQGKRPPKAKEPELRSQLEGAQRELEVLQRRLALAGSDRSRFIQEHSEEILGLLAHAHATEGEKVAAGARQVLADLLTYFRVEDDARALRRLVPAPVEENTGEPQRSSTVWGPVTTTNVSGGPQRGDLEATLRYLESLGTPTVIEGEDAEGAA